MTPQIVPNCELTFGSDCFEENAAAVSGDGAFLDLDGSLICPFRLSRFDFLATVAMELEDSVSLGVTAPDISEAYSRLSKFQHIKPAWIRARYGRTDSGRNYFPAVSRELKHVRKRFISWGLGRSSYKRYSAIFPVHVM